MVKHFLLIQCINGQLSCGTKYREAYITIAIDLEQALFIS